MSGKAHMLRLIDTYANAIPHSCADEVIYGPLIAGRRVVALPLIEV
jgi:hypothetical protein